MPLYQVKKGDCIGSIASAHGLTWQKIWDHPENADLKQRRDPNILKPGDRLFIPDRETKEESVVTGQRHRFKVKDVPAMLHLRLVDGENNPRAGLNYTINVDGLALEGTTDDDGCIDESIPPNAKKAILTVHPPAPDTQEEQDDQVFTGPSGQTTSDTQQAAPREEYEIHLGSVDPADEVAGIQQRLVNLGYELVRPSGHLDEPTRNALMQIQKQRNMDVTGTLDDATRQAIEDLHGS